MKVLFLLPYPSGKAPSQRFRVEKLLYLLDEANIDYKMRHFISEELHSQLYIKGNNFKKAAGLIIAYFRRAYTIFFEARKFDKVFIHREAAPLGPPIFEWYLAKVLAKPIIYDFDDALWQSDAYPKSKLAVFAKAYWKIKFICKWSAVISAGNDFLLRYATAHSLARVTYIPTVADTVKSYDKLKVHSPGRPVVGWTGSHSTVKYLRLIAPIIRKLQEDLEFSFLIIADRDPELDLKNKEFIRWNADTEIRDLGKIDIGLMPLPQDQWSEGKCGFKIIQYLALGIPAIASDVGVNSKIIDHEINGYLCRSDTDWEQAIRSLVGDSQKRIAMGRSGRNKIVSEFSVNAIHTRFLGLFHQSRSRN